MIPSDQPHLFIATATHEGMRGKNNEDRFGVTAHRMEPGATPVVFAVLCDGIGGHRAGEVAAELAVETVSKAVAESSGSRPLDTLKEGIQRASQAIRALADSDSGKKGMGATCTTAWIIGDQLYTAYVGDSRLYLVRGGKIQQVTIDHTWVQEAIEYGVLTPEQARSHPNAHVIRRYLGSQELPEVDFRQRLSMDESSEQSIANQGSRLQAGDFLLLCSDGLSDLVEPGEILNILQTQERKRVPQVLVDLANARGGHDNITVILLEVPAQPGNERASAPTVVQVLSKESDPTQRVAVASPIPPAAKPAAKPAPAPTATARRKLSTQMTVSCLAILVGGVLISTVAMALLWYLNSQGILELPWLPGPTPTSTQTSMPVLTPPVIEFPTSTLPPTPEDTATATLPAVPPTSTQTHWPTKTPEAPPSSTPTQTPEMQITGTPTLTPETEPSQSPVPQLTQPAPSG